LFSTDHSKPLSTLSGGLVYTKDAELSDRLRQAQASAAELPTAKQEAMWRRFCLERRYCQPAAYGRLEVIDRLERLRSRLLRATRPFLDEDFRGSIGSSYPYPAKLPAFLAMIGVGEARRWPRVAGERKALLKAFLEMAASCELAGRLPKAYFDERKDIVPLRFVWTQPDGARVRERLAALIPVSWTWFMEPIVGTDEPLTALGYRPGACPVAERIGPGMVNLPSTSPNGEVFAHVRAAMCR
jgi:dTDP-4-amino-4,6-dideoxygalactose transaminase